MTGVWCEDNVFLVKRGAESRERGRPRPQQRALRFLVLSADLDRIDQIFSCLLLTAGWEGRASARLRASRRLPPGGGHAAASERRTTNAERRTQNGNS